MKIDESCIDHNTVRIIRDLIDSRYELIDNDKPAQERGFMMMTLGEIAGVIEMAEAIKEVLKA